jgi:hypothetical protein
MAEFAQSACTCAHGELLKEPPLDVLAHRFPMPPTLIAVGDTELTSIQNAHDPSMTDLLLGRFRTAVKASGRCHEAFH